MATKTIKVIKRNERNQQENSSESAPVAKKTAQETARDMVSTVSNWVNEFQQKRRTETKQALKQLFPETPQPSQV